MCLYVFHISHNSILSPFHVSLCDFLWIGLLFSFSVDKFIGFTSGILLYYFLLIAFQVHQVHPARLDLFFIFWYQNYFLSDPRTLSARLDFNFLIDNLYRVHPLPAPSIFARWFYFLIISLHQDIHPAPLPDPPALIRWTRYRCKGFFFFFFSFSFSE